MINIKELEKLFGERVYTVWDIYRMEEIQNLKINESKIRKAIKDGIFKGDKRSGMIYVRQSQLDKYFEHLGIKY